MATVVGSSTRPNGEPRDMFTTSIGSALARFQAPTHSRASTVTSVEPSQPKTLRANSSASGATPGPTLNVLLWVVESYGPL